MFIHCLISGSLKVPQLGKLAGPVAAILVLRRTISSIISLVTNDPVLFQKLLKKPPTTRAQRPNVFEALIVMKQ